MKGNFFLLVDPGALDFMTININMANRKIAWPLQIRKPAWAMNVCLRLYYFLVLVVYWAGLYGMIFPHA